MRFRDLIVAAFSAVLAGIAAAPAPATAGCQVEKFADLPVVMMGPRATIPVLVNGHPARMIIDSGAFASLFTPDSARALGLEVEPTRMIIEGLGGSSFSGATVVNVFTLAGMPIHGVPFFVGGNTLDHGVAGVMGQNLLAIGDVEYDLADGANRLFKTKGCAVADLAYWAKPDQPIGEMSIENMFGVNRRTAGEAFINGARVRVEFDTGTPSSVLSLAAAKRLGIGPGTAGVTQVGEGAGGVGGRVFRTWIAPVASFKLGGEEIRNTRLLISDFSIPGADMRVGIDFFLSHRIFVANDLHELFFTYEGGPVFRLGGKARVEAEPGASAPSPIEAGAGPTPTDAAGFERRGAALASRGDRAGAIADFTRAIALDPKDADAYLLRAQMYVREKKFSEARSDVDQAIALAPKDARARLLRAGLDLPDGDKPAALADLAVADKSLPPEAGLRVSLGNLYEAADDFPDAVEEYDLWMRQHPGDVGRYAIQNLRCWARALWNHDLNKAMADCQASLRKDPDNFAALDSRGMVHLRLGQDDAAIADYDAALKLRPKEPWSLWGRGLAELKSGKTAAGEADLAAASKLDPKLPARAAKLGLSAKDASSSQSGS